MPPLPPNGESMISSAHPLTDLPFDVLRLILEELVGDSETLSNLSRSSRALHALAFPYLLHTVDLSSHNAGRQPKHENNFLRYEIVEADYADRFRPRNSLVSRQRAFTRLITGKPGLALHVNDLTWTLIWRDFDEDSITDIDRQTWSVFGSLLNVTRLDLASLHDIHDESSICQSPERLFPALE